MLEHLREREDEQQPKVELDLSKPSWYDAEQLKLKEERLKEQAEVIAKETNPDRKARLQEAWDKERKIADLQTKVHETLGVSELDKNDGKKEAA